MNQNLEDLMYHAGLTAQGCWDGMDDYDRATIMRFAELIVRECAKIAQLQDSDCVVDVVDYNSGRTWAGIDILKHFGVSE